MQHIVIKSLALAMALSLLSGPVPAQQAKPAVSQAAKKNIEPKKAKAVKLVNLNGAAKAELKTLPGVGDAEADRIIARRPYRSKADLVTRNIIPRGTYEGLRHLVVAKPKQG